MISLIALDGCERYDDSALWNEMKSQAARIVALEAWQATVNTNIYALQNIVAALEENDYVTSVEQFAVPSPGGYYIHFTKSPQATILNGEQGKQGVTPQIGGKDSLGIYYWTLNGEFIEVDGIKLPITGDKGDKGITPQLHVNPDTDYWEVSYDGGASWTSLDVKATGPQGPMGDAIFASSGVDNSSPDYVLFTLADGVAIKVPRYSETPRLLTFGFSVSGNTLGLAFNATCTVKENAITIVVPHAEVPHLLQKKLVPEFTFEGAAVLIGDAPQESGKDSVDFASPVEYIVQGQNGGSITYTVKVLSPTGFPILSVNTSDHAAILSQDDYVDGDIRILGDMATDIFSDDISIKTATQRLRYGNYRIKLGEKLEILDMPADTSWVLLAHVPMFVDAPMRHVEFFKNGIYQGTYVAVPGTYLPGKAAKPSTYLKFFKHAINDISELDFYCTLMGYDGIELDLHYFSEKPVYHDDPSLAQPFEPFANALKENKKLNYQIDLTHNQYLNKDNISNALDPILAMLPRYPKTVFFETSDTLVAQYLQQRGYQVVFWVNPFLPLKPLNIEWTRLLSKLFAISFERSNYEHICENFADLSKWVYIWDVQSIDDHLKSGEWEMIMGLGTAENMPQILLDKTVKAVLLEEDLYPPSVKISKKNY
jgi:hypothetical protein